MGYRITFPLKVTLTADLEELKRDCKQISSSEKISIFKEEGKGVIRIQTWAELIDVYDQLCKILLGCPSHEVRDEETGERVDADVIEYKMNLEELEINSEINKVKEELERGGEMNAKTQELDKLFARWQDSYGDLSSRFAKDGIIWEEKWNQEPRKVLFLMKETNDYAGDLRQLVREHPWRVPGYWAYGLQHLTIVHTPLFIDAKKTENWQNACWSSAIVNLKKLAGGHTPDPTQMLESTKRDLALINEELDIIQPDIVVCCGTFDFIKDVISDLQPIGSDGRCYKHSNAIWIDFPHPEAMYRHEVTYYALINLYQNYQRPWAREAE